MRITKTTNSGMLRNEMTGPEGGGAAVAEPATSPETTTTSAADPSVPPSYDATGLFSPDGKFESIGEKFGNDSVSADFIDRNFKGKSPAELALHLKNNVEAARARQVAYPNAESSEEDWGAWRKAAGVPESVEQVMPEDFESFQNATGWTPEVAQPVIDAMIKAGTPGPAISAAIAAVQTAATTQGEAWKSEGQEAHLAKENALNEVWGVEKDAKISAAQGAAEKVAIKAGLSEDEVADISAGIKDLRHPGLTRVFASLADTIAEASYKGPAAASMADQFRPPREEAQSIMNDTNHPMHGKYRSGDREVHDHVDRLLKKATE